MRVRGGVLLLGAAVLVGAVAFGSRTLGVVGVGLVLAGAAARSWAALARSRAWAAVAVSPAPATEGDAVELALEATRASRIPTGTWSVRLRLGKHGPVQARLTGHGRAARGAIRLGRLPRGRYPISEAVFELTDPLGLETVELAAEVGAAAVVVYPRLVALDTLFSDAGRIGSDGRRLLLRRPAGFDFHSVREWEEGESLRRVHWPTTARRGQLMVKELEEAPRDAVVVLLDCDPAGAAGTPPDSSFDTAVRAAGSLLRAHAARGRKAALVTTGSVPVAVPLGSLADDFDGALGALAAAEPDAPHPLARTLRRLHGAAAQAGELVVVTGALEDAAVDRLLHLATRRIVSVAWIDAPSFVGRPTRMAPGALRLAAAGIPLAVVRLGDDLRAALARPREEARARA